jgi:hypothetical protein
VVRPAVLAYNAGRSAGNIASRQFFIPIQESWPVVTRKVTKPIERIERRGRTSALNAPRRRVHALAPEHVGELGSVAALAIAILAVALVIGAVVLIVSGLTMQVRYSSTTDLPPNIGDLGRLPLFGGIGLLVFAIALAAAPLALLADVKRARVATVGLSIVAALLSVAGLLSVISRPSLDPILASALGVAALIFGASALILARPGR